MGNGFGCFVMSDLMICKCGVGRSEWIARWVERSSGWSAWRWIVKESTCIWKFSLIDSGGWQAAGRQAAGGSPSVVRERYHWEIPLTGSLCGGFESERQRLMQLLDSFLEDLFSTGPPALVWMLEAKRLFSVRSLLR
ncbi:hypothetical protein LINPERHAP1_LOCUS5098 [Linum perenne]